MSDEQGSKVLSIGDVKDSIVIPGNNNTVIFRPANLKPILADAKNPYRGLDAFTEQNADNFYGREKLTQKLLQKYDAIQADSGRSTAKARILPILGPSGSGKSSLARAGLIPHLKKRFHKDADLCPPISFKPGSKPIESLAAALARTIYQGEFSHTKKQEFEELLLTRNSSGLYSGLANISSLSGNTVADPLIVFIDQFEETFLLCNDHDQRTAFIETITHAATIRHGRVFIVLAMRSDYYNETAPYSILHEVITDEPLVMRSMFRSELRDAIVLPGRKFGFNLGEETIQRLIHESQDKVGALPLLQFALSSIWEERMTAEPFDVLNRMNGIGGGLNVTAEKLYNQLDNEGKQVTRHIFSNLAHFGDGQGPGRRRVLLSDLETKRYSLPQIRNILQTFTHRSYRLLTTAHTSAGITVEVTHEALLERWDRLVRWFETDLDQIRFQRQVEDAAQEWVRFGKKEGVLWRPPKLSLLQEFLTLRTGSLTEVQLEFAETSIRAEKRRQEREKALEAEKAKRQKRIKNLAWLLGFAFLGALVATSFALENQKAAERNLYEAQHLRAKEHEENATHLVKAGFPDSAAITTLKLLKLDIGNLQPPPLSVGRLADPFLFPDLADSLRSYYVPLDAAAGAIAIAPNGRYAAFSDWNSRITHWDLHTRQPLDSHRVHKYFVYSVCFGDNGRQIISGSGSGRMVLLGC